ncbi:MAG TPA: TIGR02281 family clan AA aspartic protease [Methylophaga aminisulfidivorans]|uniref:retropepsin-like aspartic protease family protein n=1 Tax=Methylophaga TaxID=40222 RepID=UPI001767B6BB|nr:MULTISPECIES: retropepsin-like aspartic protease [Methylophaga]HIC47857.1 TIGR02281 family clan AA aspartic protease [Methylophaga sp.]HIM40834.1 TIGR02281 family clan AA aspartic protease [Methylophaga aminisulfidivorans]
MAKVILMMLIILLISSRAEAVVVNIMVVGLFKDKAVVEVDGQQHFLNVGETSPEGLKLIAANSNSATFEINGEKQIFPLGDRINSNYIEAEKKTAVTLWPTNGMYTTTGNINGYTISFLVDTGASTIAMNAATASRLGIDYLRGQQVGIRTASGSSVGYKVKLDYVQLEQIKLHNVDAVVLDGEEPSVTLLGMSFLGQLDIQHNGERLDLRQKY